MSFLEKVDYPDSAAKEYSKKFLLFIFVKTLGILLFLSSVFILLSVITYSKNDPSFRNANDGEIANLFGDRINKLICFATGPIGDIPGRFEPINTSIKKLGEEGIKEQVKRIPPKWFVEGDQAKNYYLCENAVKNISEETARNALIAMRDWNGLENLKKIKNKTLIIWGDKDKSYNFEQVSTLNNNIPYSDLKIFKNCCHNVHLEQPQKFNQVVEDFLV